MTFLNSIFLAALAAVVIPLLIHFLSRRRIKIIDFSSLRFLATMQKSKLRWLKILEMLLLFIRMAILGLIALAFARPALTGRHASTHAPASVVALIDNSPSVEHLSSRGIVFDDLKRGVSQILDMLKPGDEVTLISLSGATTVNGPYSDFARANEVLHSLQPGPSSPNIRDGLEKASEILSRSHNLNREVYIFSDFQTADWSDGSYEKLIKPEYRYFALRYANDDADNVGIVKIDFPSQLLAPGEEFDITADINNYSNKAVKSRLLELFIDGEKRAQTTVDLKPLGRSEAKFTVVPDNPGHHSGYFQLEDDDYGPDNRFYFNFEIPHKISILGVAENPEDIRVLYNILGRTQTGYIDFQGVNMSGFSKQNLSSYDVIILNDIGALSPANFNSLTDYVNSGKGLFIILGPKSNPDSYRSFLDSKAGIKVESGVKASDQDDPDSYFSLDKFDYTHPIFKIYSPQNREPAEIPAIKLKDFYKLDGGLPLARISDDRPVLAFSGKSRVLVMGFGLDRTSSDITLHSFVVPFVIRSVEFLASSASVSEEYFVSGHSITVNMPRQLSSSAATLSWAKDFQKGEADNQPAESEKIEVSRGAYGAFVNIPRAGYPGFYTLSADSIRLSSSKADTIGFFSVNHDSLESSTETVDQQHLKEILGDGLVYIDNQDNVDNQVMQAKFGFELWKYCLLLALGLLIFESILVRKAH